MPTRLDYVERCFAIELAGTVTTSQIHGESNAISQPNAADSTVDGWGFALCFGWGPLGIDHRLAYDDSGIWKRSYQLDLEYTSIALPVIGSFLLGDQSPVGNTFSRSMDAIAFSAVAAQASKYVFERKRPSQGNDPDSFFAGSGYQSFPSGEVTLVSAAITPFVLRYGTEYPEVYALELLSVYDGIARMKVQAHWQTDVIAGWVLGTGFGYWSMHTEHPLIIEWIPGGWKIGWATRF
jgi:undecaprenyl-diphosphatase